MGTKALIIVAVVVMSLPIVFVILVAPIIAVDETYTVTETVDRAFKYSVISTKNKEIWNEGEGMGFLPSSITYTSEVVIKNLEEVGGTFKVTHSWKVEWPGYTYREDSQRTYSTQYYLGPGETGVFNANFTDAGLYGPSIDFKQYSVSAPSFTEQRLVTRHRTLHKSIIEVLTGR